MMHEPTDDTELEAACTQILSLWHNDPYVEILDYGEIADLTGLDLVTVVVACRTLQDQGNLEAVWLEKDCWYW